MAKKKLKHLMLGTSGSRRHQKILQQALAHHQAGRLHQAETLYRQILLIKPSHHEVLNYLSMIEYGKGNIKFAIELLNKAINSRPDYAESYSKLGSLLLIEGKTDDAMPILKRLLILKPNCAEAHYNLGIAFKRKGDLDAAILSIRQAISLKPNYAMAYYNLGLLQKGLKLIPEAIQSFQRTLKLDPNYAPAYYNLGGLQLGLKLIPEAIQSFQRTLKLDPTHASARHLLAALSGKTTDSPPREYVTHLFDTYASNFETHLINELEYKIPDHLRKLLSENLPGNISFSKAIDLGCGTGISGQAFKDIVDYMAAIDISRNMLEQAKNKKIYNDLYLGDICEVLSQLSNLFDLFIATDVMIYIGKLEQLFSVVNSKSTPGAYFVFSIESHQEQDFILQQSGRYAHSSTYINKLATASDFLIVAQKKVSIRKEYDVSILGEIFLLKKKTLES